MSSLGCCAVSWVDVIAQVKPAKAMIIRYARNMDQKTDGFLLPASQPTKKQPDNSAFL